MVSGMMLLIFPSRLSCQMYALGTLGQWLRGMESDFVDSLLESVPKGHTLLTDGTVFSLDGLYQVVRTRERGFIVYPPSRTPNVVARLQLP
jgi:hypothetical protein